MDADQDGSPASEDCDDHDDNVHPGAEEVCDEVDNDCDGQVDEGVGTPFYRDADGDEYGAGEAVVACAAPEGTAATDGDCDDAAVAVNPGANETCNEIDDDCDGNVDEAGALGETTWYRDADGDGFGDAEAAAVACVAPSGFVAAAGDCDDGATAVGPGVTEVCNGLDDDCDGAVDDADDDRDRATASTWYADADADGYGNAAVSTVACAVPSGMVDDATDCDDSDATVHPGASELCDGLDDDCDGSLSSEEADGDGDGVVVCAEDAGGWDGSTPPAGFLDCDDDASSCSDDCTSDGDGDGIVDCVDACADADGDGYGTTNTAALACTDTSGGSCVRDAACVSTDCVDAAADTHPGAAPADSTTACMTDADGDGYGDDSPGSGVTAGSDCDDATATTYPGAADAWYDGVDADCDGADDFDADGDGYDSDGYGGTDCDDSTNLASPGEVEVCMDGLDNDCDGETDRCSLADAHVRFDGAAVNDRAAYSLAAIDFSGDGVQDLVFGAYQATGTVTEAGAVYGLLGPVTSDESLASAELQIAGESAYDYFGGEVAAADFNGDGVGDLLLGASLGDDAYLFLGPVTGSLGAGDCDLRYSPGSSARIGSAGESFDIGDVDGDGELDILWGCNCSPNYSAYLVLGPHTASGTLQSVGLELTGMRDGAVPLVADLTGDGIAEVVLGQPRYDGAWVIEGPVTVSGPVSGLASVQLTAESWGDHAGSVLAAGDLDNDGLDDLLVRAPSVDAGGTDRGAVYALFGPQTSGSLATADLKVTGETDQDTFGHAVAVGDADGDGHGDLFMTTVGYDVSASGGEGALYIGFGPLSGTLSASDLDARYVGESANDHAGGSIAIFDANGDVSDDILLGAPDADSFRGAAYLLLGW